MHVPPSSRPMQVLIKHIIGCGGYGPKMKLPWAQMNAEVVLMTEFRTALWQQEQEPTDGGGAGRLNSPPPRPRGRSRGPPLVE